MIYMQAYHTKVDHDKPVAEGIGRLVKDTFLKKGRPMEYTWVSLDAFIEHRSDECYLGRQFGGALHMLQCSYYGIRTLQLFREKRDFPDELIGAWVEPHVDACRDAYRVWYDLKVQYSSSPVSRNMEQAQSDRDLWLARIGQAREEYNAVLARTPEFYETEEEI